jgi:transcriptional regulator with XRE-family HTH domain
MQGAEFKAIREALGMTQAGLAEALGISRVFVGLMERGERPVEKRTALAMFYLARAGEASEGCRRH